MPTDSIRIDRGDGNVHLGKKMNGSGKAKSGKTVDGRKRTRVKHGVAGVQIGAGDRSRGPRLLLLNDPPA